MKIIFVDIDGPLSYASFMDGHVRIEEGLTIPYPWEKEECDALAQIIRETDAKVVISSDWRRSYTTEDFNKIFQFYDIPPVVIGATHPNKRKLSSPVVWDRACQIMDWLEEHAHEVEEWVAIDDMNLSQYFKNKRRKSPRITKRHHFHTIGDWSDTNTRLRDSIGKIVKHLHGRKN